MATSRPCNGPPTRFLSNRNPIMATNRSAVTGMYYDRESADRAYNAIRSRGYGEEDTHVLMSDETRKRHYGDNPADDSVGSKAAEGAGKGAAIGGTVGGILGAIAAIGTSVLIPGLGLAVAGPLAGALAGAGAGGATGSLLGALVGAGIPEDRAKEYESGLKQGGMVVGVTPRNDEDAAYFDREFRSYSSGSGSASGMGSGMSGSSGMSGGSGSGMSPGSMGSESRGGTPSDDYGSGGSNRM